MIADIALGVDKLHQQAMDIGQETKIHNKIIANLDGHVDTATTGLWLGVAGYGWDQG